MSDKTVYVESLLEGRWVGRYWAANGRINNSYEIWAEDAFHLEIDKEEKLRSHPSSSWSLVVMQDKETLSTGWTWVSATEATKTEKGSRHFVVTLSNTKHPITVKVHTLLDGTPILTRWLEITNMSDKPIALTAVFPWSGRLWPGQLPWAVSTFTLGYFTKQEWAWEGWFDWKPLEDGTKAVKFDKGHGGFQDPFFIARNDTIGEYFIGHLAWSANWDMQFQKDRWGLSFKIGPESISPLRIIASGETIATPTVHLGPVSGDLDTAVQAMHDHVRRRRSILLAHKPERSYRIQYMVPGDQGYYMRPVTVSRPYTMMDTTLNESNTMKAVDVAEAIGAELFILDAPWWDTTLDWVPSPKNFPRGLKPIVDYVHSKRMLFGLYTEMEGGRGNVWESKVGKEHPDWIGPGMVLKLNIPEAAAWMESEICRLVEDYELDLFRLDFNPLFTWEGSETPRDGFVENDYWRYYESFYGIYERIHKKYPDLILQEAGAGGARNDLGTVSRFHEPDMTDGLNIPREFQIYSGITLGLPPEIFVIHHAGDGGVCVGKPQDLDTVLRLHFSLSTPQIWYGSVAPSLVELSPERRERFLHYVNIYKEFIRPLFPTCKMYHHVPVTSRGGVTSSAWFAMEYASPDRAKGWATIVRIGKDETDTYLFKPRGLDPGKTYQVTFDSIGATATVDGLRLTQDGLKIRLESIGSSELLLFKTKS